MASNSPVSSRQATVAWASVATAAVVDTALVLIFALVGRRSHAEGLTLPGALQTWWPFLVALAAGWLASRAWRDPRGIVTPGLVIWVVTVALGMVLRMLGGQGVQLSFVVVASVVLGVFLLGWRAIAALVVRRRSRVMTPSS